MAASWVHFGLLIVLTCAPSLNGTIEQVDITKDELSLLVLTVATEETDGYKRFMRSVEHNGLDIKVLGMGQKWNGGYVRLYSGGGQKVGLLKDALERVKDRKNLVVMFTDSYDVVITADAKEIIKRFLKFDARVLFSAEGSCWPDKSLAVKYPVVRSGKRYLNSGVFMGYAPEMYELVAQKVLKDGDDDQLYYTNIFLNDKLRDKLSIKLDTTSRIFQNLYGAEDDIELKMDPLRGPVAKNMAYSTLPVVIHGNGLSKLYLNWMGNYLAGAWSPDGGCQTCKDSAISLDGASEDKLPLVQLSIFAEKAVPFMEEFLKHVSQQKYPKSRVNLFVHCNVPYHDTLVADFVDKYRSEYHDTYFIKHSEDMDERTARNKAVEKAIEANVDFLFTLDADAHITNPDTVKLLIQHNRPIICPMMSRPGKLWSNFWGALSPEGYYARSDDYTQVVQYGRMGLWNEPFISSAILIAKDRLPALRNAYSYNKAIDPDMSFTQFCLHEGFFMFVSNMEFYGHLIDSETFDTSHPYPELYQIFENKQDWEARYIHENYSVIMGKDSELEMPCPDVYWYPLFSERYCWELVETMEKFGKWSNGANTDPRLNGGYENVPTRDIHMNQIGMERHWLYFLDTYVRPVQEKVFIGYFHQPTEAVMNFVVRYRPDEQPSLRPHHDASTYTINVALNRRGIDYEGGGARFIRYDCAVKKTQMGWALMHPGRLTHLHEGLRTTKGTRYIMVSFINP